MAWNLENGGHNDLLIILSQNALCEQCIEFKNYINIHKWCNVIIANLWSLKKGPNNLSVIFYFWVVLKVTCTIIILKLTDDL
jgi:hypothetical protein